MEREGVPIGVTVGSADIEPRPERRSQPGLTRVERARAWADTMRALAFSVDAEPVVWLKLVDGIAHDPVALTEPSQELLLELSGAKRWGRHQETGVCVYLDMNLNSCLYTGMHAQSKSKRGLRPPLQRRSAKKLADILAATIELLEERSLEDIGVADIARRAGVSVGTIYTRFTDKEALLSFLIVQLLGKQVEGFRTLFDSREWTGVALDARVFHFAHLLVASVQLQPGLQRAILLRALRAAWDRGQEEKRLQADALHIAAAWLLECSAEMRVSHPEKSVPLAISLAMSLVQNRLLFGDGGDGADPDSLPDEIARMMLACLTCEAALPEERPQLRWPGAGFSEFPELDA
jgi:AcrR family transcriptional regulator